MVKDFGFIIDFIADFRDNIRGYQADNFLYTLRRNYEREKESNSYLQRLFVEELFGE